MASLNQSWPAHSMAFVRESAADDLAVLGGRGGAYCRGVSGTARETSPPSPQAAPLPVDGQQWLRRASAGEFGEPTATWTIQRRKRRRVVLALVCGVVVLPSVAAVVVRVMRSERQVSDLLVPIVVVAGATLIGAVWWWASRRQTERDAVARAGRQQHTEQVFGAEAVLEVQATPSSLPGMVFRAGKHSQTGDRVCWRSGDGTRSVEVGLQTYQLGTATRTDRYQCRYLAVQLPPQPGKPMAATVELVSTDQVAGSSLPMTLPGVPTRMLAGESPQDAKRYTLRAATSDAKKAAGVLTPAVVNLLWDNEFPFEAEFAEGWFFVYCFRPTDDWQQVTLPRMLRIAVILGCPPLVE